jgi:hypothetical protein
VFAALFCSGCVQVLTGWWLTVLLLLLLLLLLFMAGS